MVQKFEFDCFISHSSKDKFVARLVRGYLRSHNIDAWIDEDHTELSASPKKAEVLSRLRTAIPQCEWFFLLLSANSLASEFVEAEVAIARKSCDDGVPIKFVAIDIEDLKGELPEWARDITRVKITGDSGLQDPLKTLRDQVGCFRPTYIDKLHPHFLKQIPINKLNEHLVLCS